MPKVDLSNYEGGREQAYVKHAEKSRKRVIGILVDMKASSRVEYKELFCEAMFFPLITPNDLVEWVRGLEPALQVVLNGVPTRKKPKPSEAFDVVVIDPKAIK